MLIITDGINNDTENTLDEIVNVNKIKIILL